jgi:purine nucleosidase
VAHGAQPTVATGLKGCHLLFVAMRGVMKSAGLALALVLLALLSFAMPVASWRTGHGGLAPFVSEPQSAASALPRRVWVDTDAACEPGWNDPDDCLALLALLQTDVEVVGVSTVFGNAAATRTHSIAMEAVRRAGGGRAAVPVYRGCAEPFSACAGNAAVAALRAAIDAGPLTIVALGPVTNVARAFSAAKPAQRAQVEIVAVMGRRPGHRFHPTENRSRDAWLFGHGPVFRNLNAELDPQAVAVLLALQPRLTLVPYEAARQVMLDADDLERIAARDAAGAWIAARCKVWLAQWRERVGLDGFYPFDLVAAMYLLGPRRFDCARVNAWVGRDPQRTVFERAPALLVSQEAPPADRLAASPVRYCTAVRARVSDVL